MDIDLDNITLPDIDLGDFDYGSIPQYLDYDTDGDGVLNDAEYASYMEALTAWSDATNTDVSDDTYVPPEQTVGEVEDLISGLSESGADTLLEGMEAADRMVSGEETSTDWFYDLSPVAQAVAVYVASGGNVNLQSGASDSTFVDMNGTEYQVRGTQDALATLLGPFLDPLANISNNPLGALAQNRSRNATARAELRDKRQFINRLVDEEGYTREQARHIYYDYIGARDENPNKTLSNAQIDQLYSDYEAGNTPSAVAAQEAAAEAERQRLAEEEAERQRLAEEEAERQRLAEEEAERQRLAEEEAERQRLAEEAERQRQAAIDNAGTVFSDLGYEATQEEKEQFADNPDGIAGYVDPRQLTRAELEAIAAEQNYTLQDSDYETYVGQGDENFQTSQTTTANSTFDPLAVTSAEAKAFLEAQNGFEPSQAQIDKFTGYGTEAEAETAVKDYVDKRQFTEEEARAYLADLGYESPTQEEVNELVGQGGATFESTQRTATQTFVTSQQNAAKQAFEDAGYTPTTQEIKDYADNQSAIGDYIDGKKTEAQQAFEDAGYTPTDQEVADYADNISGIGDYVTQQNELAEQQAALARQEALDNAESIFNTAGYNPSAEEVETFADNPEGIPAYVNPRQVTAQEAAMIFQETYGYEPDAYEIQEFMGQGDENFQANQETAIGDYVDPRQVTREELEAVAEEQGYTLTEDDYKKYVGQTNNREDDDYDRRISELADVELDAKAVTEAELETIAAEQGFDLSELNDKERAALLGNVVEEDVVKQLDEEAVTRAELEDIARQENYDLANLSEDEINQLVGNNKEADIIKNIDSRAVNVADVIEIYKDQIGEDIDEETALQILMSAGYPVGENGELLPGGPNEETFKEYIGNVEMSFEERMKLFLDKASRLGQNVLDLIFGKHPTGRSKTLAEIWAEQRERLLPPSPLDPDYEKKMIEWIKNRSGSILSVNHEILVYDPNTGTWAPDNPLQNPDGTYNPTRRGAWAGVRFPVPIPITGPEIKIPLWDPTTGEFIGVGAAAGLFIDELGNVVNEAGRRVGQIASTGIQLIDEAGNVLRTIPLTMTGTDEYGNPEYEVKDWEEGDDNPFELDENGDGIVDEQFDENGIPIDPNTGLPVVEVPDDIEEGDRVAFLSDVVAAKEEVLDTLGSQLEALGLDVNEVKTILDGVQEQLDGVATPEDLEALRSDLNQTITDELAALGIDDVKDTLDAVGEDLDSLGTSLDDLSRAVGLPAREDDPNTEEDESRPATGIYAAIEEGDAATKEYIDGLVEDIESLGVDVAAIPGLIEGIIESTSAELEALGLNQQQIIDLLGSPATDDAEATGLYATIDDLAAEVETLSTDLNTRIDALVEAGSSRADAVDQALAELAEANSTSTEAILARLGTTEEELTGQISELSGRVGTPAEYDDEGNLVTEATGLYAEINTLMTEQGLSYQEALDTAISGLSSELGLTEQNLLDALGTTRDELLGEISGLSRRVGTPAEYDDEGNLVTEATGLYKEIDDLVADGMTRAEAVDTALANLAEQYNTSTEAILGQLGTTQEQLTGLETDLGDLSGRVGTPAEYDDEGNLVTESTGLYAEIDALVADGVARDEAINQVLSDLATAYNTNTETLLTALGTTEDAIREDIAGVAEDVAGLTEDVAGLADDVDNIDTRIDDLVEAGVEQTEAINTAIAELSDKYDLTTGEILDAISDSESRLSTQIGLPARADDPDTEEDESRPATGLYAEINAAEATITADISDLTDLVMAYEAAGLSRDEALATAITDLSEQLGLTEERFLTSLGETELSIQTSIDEAEANIQASIEEAEATITADISDLTDLVMAYEADGIARDEAITLAVNDLSGQLGITRDELLTRIGESESTIMDAIDASQMETNQYLDYISGVIGRPASELTQDDVDMVIDLLAEDEFITDFNNDIRLYDVNFDGQIDQSDIGLLQGFVNAGVEGVGEIPATGLYADAARRQAEITGDIRDTQELITTEAEATRGLVGTEAEETRRLMGQQNLFNAFLGSGDLMGRQVDVKTPDPVQLKYIYDFSDIFATPQQRGLFPSPYGAPQRQAAQQVAQQRGIMSGPLQLGGLQRQPGMAAGGKVDYDFTDEIMHIMSYGDS